jgi:hypothetical protein
MIFAKPASRFCSIRHWPCLALACFFAVSGVHAEEGAGTGSFKIHPHPPDVKLSQSPKLEDPQAFSMIVLGDPQSYVKFDINQPIFELLTAWTAAQKQTLNVKTVICTGDLVEQNELLIENGGTLYAGRNNGNQTSTKQWENVSQAFRRLDGVYPYVVTTGNHDYGYESAENRNSRFPDYFNPSRNPLWAKTLVATGSNAFGHPTLENAAYEFADKVWGDLLVVVLEFAPRDEAIDWGAKLISSEKYAGHKVILLTHSVLDTRGGLIETSGYKVAPRNEGAQLLEKLIKPSKNIKLVICGHSGDPDTMSAFRSENNADGKPVHIMMFNPQAISGWNGNGGDGWLRILEFGTDGKTIKARTYSPLFAASQKTESEAWSTKAEDEFQFAIDEPSPAQ